MLATRPEDGGEAEEASGRRRAGGRSPPPPPPPEGSGGTGDTEISLPISRSAGEDRTQDTGWSAGGGIVRQDRLAGRRNMAMGHGAKRGQRGIGHRTQHKEVMTCSKGRVRTGEAPGSRVSKMLSDYSNSLGGQARSHTDGRRSPETGWTREEVSSQLSWR